MPSTTAPKLPAREKCDPNTIHQILPGPMAIAAQAVMTMGTRPSVSTIGSASGGKPGDASDLVVADIRRSGDDRFGRAVGGKCLVWRLIAKCCPPPSLRRRQRRDGPRRVVALDQVKVAS